MKPRDQPGWHKASEWLLALTLAVHGFGNDYHSAQSRVSVQDVKEVFQKYGEILHAQIWKSQKGGAWAFVTFASMEDRDAAMHDLNGQTVDLWTRNGNRQILWQTPLRVSAPRFHSVRFYYDQYAAKRIVPVEMVFTPSAEPGQGGSFQRALGAPRRSFVLPPTGPRHGRRRAQNISIDTSFNNRHDRPSSPAPSNAGMSIQWGHEPRETPEPSSPAYDSEKTYCSSGGENLLPGDDDGEEMEEYDSYGEDDAEPRSSSPFERPPAPRDSPSPIPSSRYDDQDDTSIYPQSSRGTAEPNLQNRKRRRYDDDYEEDESELRATIRKLREENDRLQTRLENARDEADTLREEKKAIAKEAEAERLANHQRVGRLTDQLLAHLEGSRRDERPQKRSKVASPFLEPEPLDYSSSYAPFPMTTTNLLSSLQTNPAAAALLSALLQGHMGQVTNSN